jgi:dCMP deaminase
MNKWDERFVRIAQEVASWSKDPGTKVGAVLVNDKRILATGYNGFPSGISDSLERYMEREVKLAYTVHAEVNALLNAARNGAETEGSMERWHSNFELARDLLIEAGLTVVNY